MPSPRSLLIAGIATDTTLPSRNTAPEPRTEAARIHWPDRDVLGLVLLGIAGTYQRTNRPPLHEVWRFASPEDMLTPSAPEKESQ